MSSLRRIPERLADPCIDGKYAEYYNPVTQQNPHVLSVNLLSGLVSAAAAAQTTDMYV